MKIKSGLVAVAAVLSLGACTDSSDAPEVAASEAAAAAVETDEQVAARIEASLSPLDYRLRQVTCNEAISAAKRAREGTFDAELTARVAEAPRMDFIKLVRSVRELDSDAQAVNTAQRAGLPLPQKAEDSTPEYVAQTRECLAIITVEKARQDAA